MSKIKSINYSEVAADWLNLIHRELRNDRTIWLANDSGNMVSRFVVEKLMDEGHNLDACYQFTAEALMILADRTSITDEDGAHKAIDEIEADIYTSELTEWLNDSNEHVYWLSKVLEEYEPEDGFSALSLAQKLAKENVGHLLVDFITDEAK